MEATRRDLFKFTGLAAAGVVGASALAGCAPKTAAETASLADTGSADSGLPAFLQAPEPISDFADTREYDIVVVGAGESGLSAAHSAGVICETEEGNVLFKASKGVILASGDCSGNQEMRDYYCPDLRGFKTMSPFRDGMGMMTGIWAGAQMTPVNHSKMVHGGGALTRLELPFLNLDIHGERFMNEVLSFAYLNNLMRGYLEEYDFQNPMAAKFFTIMPANWVEIGEQWAAAHPEEVKFGVGNMKIPSEDQFVKGETFAELAANINAYMEAEEWHIDPIDEQTIVASIEAYNELCATGSDGQFGKRADYLVPIEQGPFFAVPRGANSVPAVLGGLTVNENQQCLNADGAPIEGLFAVGNASGQFYGGVDYPMDVEGLSIGRAITSGYVTGRYVAAL